MWEMVAGSFFGVIIGTQSVLFSKSMAIESIN